MRLNELLRNVKPIAIQGSVDVEITGIEIDSRKVTAGNMFVAIKGTLTDGHRFLDKAIEQGAVAVLVEEMPEDVSKDIVYVQMASTEAAVGKIATLFYGEPSRKLKLVA